MEKMQNYVTKFVEDLPLGALDDTQHHVSKFSINVLLNSALEQFYEAEAKKRKTGSMIYDEMMEHERGKIMVCLLLLNIEKTTYELIEKCRNKNRLPKEKVVQTPPYRIKRVKANNG